MSVLDADTTVHPVQPPDNTRNALPEGFFTGHIHTPPTSPSKRPFVARPPSASRSAFVDQLSSLFRRPLSYVRDYTTHDMPSRHTIFSWYQLKRDQPDTKLELQPEVEVPYTRDLVNAKKRAPRHGLAKHYDHL
ncbi:hypothetical protein M405DRAFT_839168 [Rhizopogon salebrosus TDB-379]|nr:hypothetical protein M405DRAFT_839168 [Rhizopogon salebrosus TDB-379]